MIYDEPPLLSLRPPLGVIPKWLWIEKMNNDRIDQLKAAIKRSMDANHRVPPEWVEEYNELVNIKK
jgi:hypothetical protein